MSVDECQSTDLNKKIPEEFVANFDPYRIMLKYKEHKKIAPIMMALTGVRQEAGALILDYQPGAPTPGVEALPDSPLEVSAVRTLLAISVIFTFTLTGFLVWNKMRKKKKNN